MGTTENSLVFLSWKGRMSLSWEFAVKFGNFLSENFHQERTSGRIFISDATQHIAPGDQARDRIMSALSRTRVLVAFITRENAGSARWLEYEAAAVDFAGGVVIPILIDLAVGDLPPTSAFAGPLSHLQCWDFRRRSNARELAQLVSQIARDADFSEKCLMDLLDDLNSTHPFSDLKMMLDSALARDAEKNGPAGDGKIDRRIVDRFTSDQQFDKWIYAYHKVIHAARDEIVRFMNGDPGDAGHMPDPEALLCAYLDFEPDAASPSTILRVNRDRISAVVNAIESLFRMMFRNMPEVEIWACLRELRKDSRYHNFIRSTNAPAGRGIVPWPKDHLSIVSLRNTLDGRNEKERMPDGTIGQNCTVRTEWGDPDFPPTREGAEDPNRRNSILAAVLLKRIVPGEDQPQHSAMWCVLCVNSNQRDTFTHIHQTILQGCNDALSAVLNVLFRSYHSESNLYSQDGEH